jgi:hypothetical protein
VQFFASVGVDTCIGAIAGIISKNLRAMLAADAEGCFSRLYRSRVNGRYRRLSRVAARLANVP